MKTHDCMFCHVALGANDTCPECGEEFEISEPKERKDEVKKASKKKTAEEKAINKLPKAAKELAKKTNAKADPKKPSKEVRAVNVTRHLKVKLTDEEIAQRSDEGAHCWAKIKELEADGKAYAARIKAQISEATGKMDTLQQEVRDHCTYRDVDCVEVTDYSKKTFELIRRDTNEVVEARKLRNDELQTTLPGVNPEAKKEPVKEKKANGKRKETLEEEGDRTRSEIRKNSAAVASSNSPQTIENSEFDDLEDEIVEVLSKPDSDGTEESDDDLDFDFDDEEDDDL